jgi:hypothetical protein
MKPNGLEVVSNNESGPASVGGAVKTATCAVAGVFAWCPMLFHDARQNPDERSPHCSVGAFDVLVG